MAQKFVPAVPEFSQFFRKIYNQQYFVNHFVNESGEPDSQLISLEGPSPILDVLLPAICCIAYAEWRKRSAELFNMKAPVRKIDHAADKSTFWLIRGKEIADQKKVCKANKTKRCKTFM